MMSRFELASRWRAKGRFWTLVVCAFAVVAVALIPVQFAVVDAFWSSVIVVSGWLAIAAQIAAFVRMVVCYRRAVKARRMMDTTAWTELPGGPHRTHALPFSVRKRNNPDDRA